MAAIASPAATDTMKCVHASALGGDIDEVLSISEAPKPSSDLVKDGKTMIVKVEACSISRGDSIMLEGACDLMMNPKLPFVPGMDICGVVEEIAEGCNTFKVGDRIIATNGMDPTGGLAEYAAIKTKFAGKAPASVDPAQAAVLPNSPVAAMHAARAAGLKEGDRVMVLGGSGGVGSSLLQLVKDAKASYLATTSTAEDLCKSLGADTVIDYRETNWYEDEHYKAEPFDVVFDCVGWRDEWKAAGRSGVLKSGWNGGRYICIATNDDPQIHSVWQVTKMFVPILWRSGYTLINRLRPRYKLMISDPIAQDLADLAELVTAGRLNPVLDPASPFPFTADGVKAAFKLQASKHAHGKVVVTVS
ncbi:unnamed protein product [Pylaiella littoralis]